MFLMGAEGMFVKSSLKNKERKKERTKEGRNKERNKEKKIVSLYNAKTCLKSLQKIFITCK